jgi:hypothetical protein
MMRRKDHAPMWANTEFFAMALERAHACRSHHPCLRGLTDPKSEGLAVA